MWFLNEVSWFDCHVIRSLWSCPLSLSYFSRLNQSWSSWGNMWHNAIENFMSRSRFPGCFRLKSLKHYKNCASQRSLEMPKRLHFDRNNALAITRISWKLDIVRKSCTISAISLSLDPSRISLLIGAWLCTSRLIFVMHLRKNLCFS